MPRIIQSVSTDFTVETKINETMPMDEDSECAGILAYKDDDNFLRVERGWGPAVYFAGRSYGNWLAIAWPSLSTNINPTYLRLVKVGLTYIASYRSIEGLHRIFRL